MREAVKHSSTPPVSPKSDSARWNQTCPAEITSRRMAQGKLESFFASPRRLSRRSLTKVDGKMALKCVCEM